VAKGHDTPPLTKAQLAAKVEGRPGSAVAGASRVPRSFTDKQSAVEKVRRRKFIYNNARRLQKARRAEVAFVRAFRKEKRYRQQQVEEATRRTNRAQEMDHIRSISPVGATWVLGDKKHHTPDCLAMAGYAWNWSVLAIVNPANRHPGCGCTLRPVQGGDRWGEWLSVMEEGAAEATATIRLLMGDFERSHTPLPSLEAMR
jgi:hypothetical protein